MRNIFNYSIAFYELHKSKIDIYKDGKKWSADDHDNLVKFDDMRMVEEL